MNHFRYQTLIGLLLLKQSLYGMSDLKNLRTACEEGNIVQIRQYLKKNNVTLSSDALGQSLLCIAAAEGHESLVSFFVNDQQIKGNGPRLPILAAPSNVNPQENPEYLAGGSPLHYACQKKVLADEKIKDHELYNRKMNIIRVLLKNGYGPWELTESHANCLHIACLDQDANFVAFLINELNSLKIAFDWLNWPDRDGRTPLHLCCAQLMAENVHTLLLSKAKTNLQTEQGITPLHETLKALTTQENYHTVLIIVQDLINYKADPHIRDFWGTTPSHLACRNGYIDVVEFLIKDEECANNTGKCILANRIQGYIPENMHETTALHHAAAGGHQKVVTYLVDTCGANVNHQAELGATPLHYALFYQGQNNELIRHLADRMNDTKNAIAYCHFSAEKNEWGTPLHLLKKQTSDSELETYLKHKGFIDTRPNALQIFFKHIQLRPKVLLLAIGGITLTGILLWRGLIKPEQVIKLTVAGGLVGWGIFQPGEFNINDFFSTGIRKD